MNYRYNEMVYDKLQDLESCFLCCLNLEDSLMCCKYTQDMLIPFYDSVQSMTSQARQHAEFSWSSVACYDVPTYFVPSPGDPGDCLCIETLWLRKYHACLPLCLVIVLIEC